MVRTPAWKTGSLRRRDRLCGAVRWQVRPALGQQVDSRRIDHDEHSSLYAMLYAACTRLFVLARRSINVKSASNHESVLNLHIVARPYFAIAPNTASARQASGV
jgi:hypothetical protein